MGYSRLPEVRQRHEAAVAETAALVPDLVYTPMALADIPALVSEVVELRRLYLSARGLLRDLVGDDGIARLGLGGTNPQGLPPTE